MSEIVFPPAEIHFTPLKQIELSAAHFRAKCLEPADWTRPKSNGSLLHCLVLGGDYVVWHKERRGNAWDAFEAEHKTQNPDRLIVTQKEYDQVVRAADALLKHPDAAPLLTTGDREKSLSWTVMGRAAAGRLDVVGDNVVDLKSTRCAEPAFFRRQAIGLRYHAQLAWYRDGARANGYAAKDAFIVAVELKPPFAVTVFRLTERDFVEGQKHIRLWMERLLGCEREGIWPAYVQSVVELNVSESEGLLIGGEEVEAA